jgi:hypothetical protein
MARPLSGTLVAVSLALGVAVSGPSQGDQSPASPTDEPTTVAVAPADEAKAASSGDRQVEVSPPRAGQVARMTCKTVKVTGSNVRTRQVCTTPDQTDGAADWVRQRQDRGAIEGSRALNGGT